jgi:serine O-acetyltransferase
MINSYSTYKYFLEADRIALGRSKKHKGFYHILIDTLRPDYIYDFQRLLRRVEYSKNCKSGLLNKLVYAFLVWRFHKLSLKLGFSISINTIGPGLSIAHHGTIIINSGARIGANCRINCDVNIGTQAGYANKAPQIGDNVYIGPGAKIYGDIRIASNTAIGANSVVNKSFIEEGAAIAGVPAKVISNNIDVFNLLIPATKIAKGEFIELPGMPAIEQNNIRNST